MNPANGEVYAMGSAPSFDPTMFTKPISKPTLSSAQLRRAAAQPLFDRAARGRLSDRLDVQADHRAGRAAAPATITPAYAVVDGGCIKIGDVQERCNAGQDRLRLGRPARRAEGLLRRLLLHARAATELAPTPR